MTAHIAYRKPRDRKQEPITPAEEYGMALAYRQRRGSLEWIARQFRVGVKDVKLALELYDIAVRPPYEGSSARFPNRWLDEVAS